MADASQSPIMAFAFEHAVYLWNNIPNKTTRLAPIEAFSGLWHGTSQVLN
jgi:hypothetical protein